MAASEDSSKAINKVDLRDNDSSDESGSSSIEHPFTDPEIADRWRKVYENAKYENRHRFDPNFTWTAQEEKKLVRKVFSLLLKTHQCTYDNLENYVC